MSLKQVTYKETPTTDDQPTADPARKAIEDFARHLDKAIGEWPDKLQRTLLRAGLEREKEKYLKHVSAR